MCETVVLRLINKSLRNCLLIFVPRLSWQRSVSHTNIDRGDKCQKDRVFFARTSSMMFTIALMICRSFGSLRVKTKTLF